MCRHLAYLGPPTALAELLLSPPHSLLRQSWAPTDMRKGGTINADGFGIGWYPEPGRPVRYRRATPMWSDENLPGLAGVTHSTALLAAIRSATVGMPVVDTASMPFAEGRWLFSHNGVIAGWPGSVADLAARLPVTDLMTLDAPTDAALLWALVRHRLRAGTAPEVAVAEVVTTVAALAPGSRLNLLLTGGDTLVATTWWHSLSVLHDGERTVIASEPYDTDPAWTPVADRQLLLATRTGLTQYALERGSPVGARGQDADV
ncbi:MAG TPA: ergothioneine biosynthesis protein EgtC [Pseudonocardiaceae bacterium]|nr:ergothioneine biosynthesis protein EgtC [Pseudonocardiaceae bacterium]